MGYLNNSTVTVDAILTTKGREALSKGTATGLDIRYFALGDDEVNYDLWNPAHPLGSDYYGIIIENMPVLEASPIPEQNLKSKLISLDKNTTSLKTIQSNLSGGSIGTSTAPVQYDDNGIRSLTNTIGSSIPVTFTLSATGAGSNNTLGYTITYDSRYFAILPGPLPPGFSGTSTNNINTSPSSVIGDAGQNSLTSTVTAGAITLLFTSNIPSLPTGNSIQNIFVQGNEVGGQLTIPVYFRRGNVGSGGSL
jgi:hypothetical protein